LLKKFKTASISRLFTDIRFGVFGLLPDFLRIDLFTIQDTRQFKVQIRILFTEEYYNICPCVGIGSPIHSPTSAYNSPQKPNRGRETH
jgi:hypothetical protein